MTNETKQAIRELLMKYLDPKPEYSGITAHEITEKISGIIALSTNLDHDCHKGPEDSCACEK